MAKQKLNQQETILIKFLHYVLGHHPDEFGLWPDAEGFVLIQDLTQTLRAEDGFKAIRENQITQLVNVPNDETDFEISGKQIRLKPEFSAIKKETKPVVLPKFLYFPLKPNAWEKISEDGLSPKYGEPTNLLWAKKETAIKIGKRISHEHLLIKVLTTVALKNKNDFNFLTENLWSSDFIGAESLEGPTIAQKTEKELLALEKKNKAKRLKQLEKSGSFKLSMPNEPVVHRGKKKGKHEDSPDWKNQLRRQKRKKTEGDW